MLINFDNITKRRQPTWMLLFIVCMTMVLTASSGRGKTEIVYLTRVKKVVVEAPEFSEEVFFEYIKSVGIKFPHIVMAQATVESGRFTSAIFRHSHNAFGMKVARSRPTTAIKESRGHALYADWRMSVIDYALFQSAFMRKIRTEDGYYDYLSRNYAEDPGYVSKLRKIAEQWRR